jgi:Na+/H+ antiporter NhaC
MRQKSASFVDLLSFFSTFSLPPSAFAFPPDTDRPNDPGTLRSLLPPLLAIGSVLAGSVFGDHCSPISDTTVLSSRASQCDYVAHVRTQMPYALTVAAVSMVCGTIPVGFGCSVWLALPMSAGGLARGASAGGKIRRK